MLIFGTAQLRGEYGVIGRPEQPTTDADAHALLANAARLGIGALDTAPSYRDAEELIGSSGVSLPVHTKLDPELEPSASLRRSLRRLARDRVGLLYFHTPGIALDDPSDQIPRARELVGSRVDALGASVYEPEEFAAAVEDGRFGAVQAPINVLDRRLPARELRRAREHGVAVFARSVMLQGLLLAAPEMLPPKLMALAPFVAAVQRVAGEAQLPMLSVLIGWVRDLPGITGVVVGARNSRELGALVEAWSTPPLPAAVRDAIDSLPTPPPEWRDPRRWSS